MNGTFFHAPPPLSFFYFLLTDCGLEAANSVGRRPRALQPHQLQEVLGGLFQVGHLVRRIVELGVAMRQLAIDRLVVALEAVEGFCTVC